MRTTLLLLSAFLLLPAAGLLTAAPASAEGELEIRRNLLVRTVEKRRSAVVSIRTNQIVKRSWFDIWGYRHMGEPYERDGGLGSGAIFHPDGYVITNAHVISRATKIFVGIPKYDANGQSGEAHEHRALPVAIDIENDLAILRLMPDAEHHLERFPYIPLGRSNDLMIGEGVIAMGHPFRLGFTVTRGIVSGLNRALELGGRKFDDFMQVDAAINPGNSGGPLFDVTGRWIGVNTAIYNRAHGAEGIGFAIPADRVRSLIAKAFKRRVITGDWLGIEFMQGKQGEARVKRVFPTGPAARAGIAAGDVIAAAAGKPTPSLFDLRMRLIGLDTGAQVPVMVRRDGRPLRGNPLRLVLQPVPTNRLSAKHLGFTAEDTGESNGVLVASIKPEGPAARMNMRPKDRIFALGGWEIRNTEDLLLFLQFVSPGDLVDVKIFRQEGRRARRLEGSMRAE
ncbi:MAG: trypsin-like peptidase domain-containing protein [Planctomycetota bacterium]|nr:trypsin-like peptidase domain-containing protein [Planctomycetota bacterium]